MSAEHASNPSERWGGLGEERRSLPPSKTIGIDVGSTTVKAVVVSADGKATWQDYQRHNTRQAEKVVEFLSRMETEAGLSVGTDRVFFTGSGAGFIAPLVGGKMIQEVVAVAACVEKEHPDVRFVSEIGGEDMKTIFFTAAGDAKSKQVYMQSACSGGAGAFIAEAPRQRPGALPDGRDPASLIIVPKEALYYACLGCVEIGKDEAPGVALYQGREKLQWWIETGQHEEKAKSGARGLIASIDDFSTFNNVYGRP